MKTVIEERRCLSRREDAVCGCVDRRLEWRGGIEVG